MYWATNVDTYPAVTWSSPNGSQNHMTAGNDAAISRGSCQASRIVSTNTWTVMKLWLTISGRASAEQLAAAPERGDSGGGIAATASGRASVRSAASSMIPLRLITAFLGG